MSFANVGTVWSREGLQEHLETLPASGLSWVKGICIHHTYSPSLAQRPQGLKVQHIRNIAHYYRHKLGWSRGPHMFVDEDQGFGMTPFWKAGIHARGFNQTHLGIELLGNFDSREEYESARGRAVFKNAARLVAELCRKLGFDSSYIVGHRDSPRTSKTCPGAHFDLREFRRVVGENLASSPEPSRPVKDRLRELEQSLVDQLDLVREILNYGIDPKAGG